MNLSHLSDFLLYSLVINYLILIIWFVVFVFAKDWMKRLHGHWFKLSDQQFDAIHYGGMAVYKIGILLLNLTPYIALHYLK
ncbi:MULTISPECIES: DUF6868 family protein [unclassified Acinetobacter]|uniref:DUF6868 family protein n=1 Tax=unclassified Acinetobacter TaxID=196816 RepID=UPI0015D0FB55|nr:MULTISPECIES: hypothetical protein [unclassified Acinetobacter]